MTATPLYTDDLGAGATAMAFVDTLLGEQSPTPPCRTQHGLGGKVLASHFDDTDGNALCAVVPSPETAARLPSLMAMF